MRKEIAFTLATVVCLEIGLGQAAADAPPGRYVVTADIVTDTKTGLVWQRAISPRKHTQASALQYCAALELGDSSDWRLPTIQELLSLVDPTQFNPSIDRTAFPGTPSEWFWTSSACPNPPEAGYKWFVDFDKGYSGCDVHGDDFNQYPIRCVR